MDHENIIPIKTENNSSIRKTVGKSKTETIKNFNELINVLYKKKFTRQLKKDEIKNIMSSPMPTDDERNNILTQIKADKTLQQTQYALKFTLSTNSNLKERIKIFLFSAIKQHVFFQNNTISSIFDNNMDNSNRISVLKEFRELDFLCDNDDFNRLSKAESASAKKNVFNCILLIFALNGVCPSEILQHIYDNGKSKIVKKFSNYEIINTIVGTKDITSIIMQFELMMSKNKEFESEIDLLNKKMSNMELKRIELESHINDLKEKINEERNEKESLNEEISKISALRSTENIEYGCKMARFKEHALHKLCKTVENIELGLVALQRTPPKINVMIDYAERAADGLKTEIKILRQED